MLPPAAFISYSHDSLEHEAWVLKFATQLRANGVDVALDQWDLRLGNDLPMFMEQGLSEARWVIAVCSDLYTVKYDQRTGGTGYEARILSADLLSGNKANYVIPLIRNNLTNRIPTALNSTLYADFRDESTYDIRFETVLRTLVGAPVLPKPSVGPNPFAPRQNGLYVPPSMLPSRYVSPAIQDTVSFNYENNNGVYVIGCGDTAFATMWSQCGPGSIYALSDQSTIFSVAVAPNAGALDVIGDGAAYDGSSRHRTASVGDVVIYRNVKDYWAAVLVRRVTVRGRGDSESTLDFDYIILTDRSSRFDSKNEPA